MALVSDLVEMCICQGAGEKGGWLIHLVVMRRVAGDRVRWGERGIEVVEKRRSDWLKEKEWRKLNGEIGWTEEEEERVMQSEGAVQTETSEQLLRDGNGEEQI